MTARTTGLSAALALSLFGCASLLGLFQEPDIDFETVRFKAASFEALKADLVFSVKNPNAVGVKLDGYALRFAVDGLTLLDGRVDQALDLRAGKTAELVLPVTIKWKELAARIARGGGVPDSLPWSAAGSMHWETPIGPLDLPFAADGAVPVIKPPSIAPVGIRLLSAGLTGAKVAIDLDVGSPSGRTLGLLGFAPQVTLNGRRVAGAKLDDVQVSGRDAVRRTLTLDLSLASAGSALAGVLTGGGRIDVALKGDSKVDTGFGKLPWSFDVKRGLDLRR